MKIRLADKGLLLVVAPLFILAGSFGAMIVHKQGSESAAIIDKTNGDNNRLVQARSDIENRLDWTIALDVTEGKNVGDYLKPPKKGTVGARTIRVIPLPNKTLAPDQILFLDPATAKILSIFSTSQIKQTTKQPK